MSKTFIAFVLLLGIAFGQLPSEGSMVVSQVSGHINLEFEVEWPVALVVIVIMATRRRKISCLVRSDNSLTLNETQLSGLIR